jgi:hypothetical protein
LRAGAEYPCHQGISAPSSGSATPIDKLTTTWAECDTLGITNTREILSLAVLADVNLTTRFALHIVGELGWYQAVGLANATQTTETGFVIDLPDASLTHWRNVRLIELGASYSFFAWMSLGLSVTTLFAERNYDGAIRAPFIPADTLFGLRVLISLDEVYLALTGVRTGTAAPIPKK